MTEQQVAALKLLREQTFEVSGWYKRLERDLRADIRAEMDLEDSMRWFLRASSEMLEAIVTNDEFLVELCQKQIERHMVEFRTKVRTLDQMTTETSTSDTAD